MTQHVSCAGEELIFAAAARAPPTYATVDRCLQHLECRGHEYELSVTLMRPTPDKSWMHITPYLMLLRSSNTVAAYLSKTE